LTASSTSSTARVLFLILLRDFNSDELSPSPVPHPTSSAREKRVAYPDELSVLPCAGNDAFGCDAIGNLSLALEGWILDSN
jgi:hypothetical protein